MWRQERISKEWRSIVLHTTMKLERENRKKRKKIIKGKRFGNVTINRRKRPWGTAWRAFSLAEVVHSIWRSSGTKNSELFFLYFQIYRLLLFILPELCFICSLSFHRLLAYCLKWSFYSCCNVHREGADKHVCTSFSIDFRSLVVIERYIFHFFSFWIAFQIIVGI